MRSKRRRSPSVEAAAVPSVTQTSREIVASVKAGDLLMAAARRGPTLEQAKSTWPTPWSGCN